MSNSKDLKIICSENCGNSPKKQLLKEFTIAFVKNEIEFCLEWVKDDVIWKIIGAKQVEGKEEYEEALNQLKKLEVIELQISNIITHGNTASVNGRLTLKDKHTIEFCDVYRFSGFGKNAKIKMITSYVIKVDAGT